MTAERPAWACPAVWQTAHSGVAGDSSVAFAIDDECAGAKICMSAACTIGCTSKCRNNASANRTLDLTEPSCKSDSVCFRNPPFVKRSRDQVGLKRLDLRGAIIADILCIEKAVFRRRCCQSSRHKRGEPRTAWIIPSETQESQRIGEFLFQKLIPRADRKPLKSREQNLSSPLSQKVNDSSPL
jgi:hypothetical protein